MTTPKQPARSIAILELPHPVPALIGVAKAIVQAMTGNAMFPNPDPTLATVTVAINDLDASETVAKTRAHGAVAIRNDKRTTLVKLLEQLRAYVQKVADANPETSGSVIQSAGIGVKKPFLRGKPPIPASDCQARSAGPPFPADQHGRVSAEPPS